MVEYMQTVDGREIPVMTFGNGTLCIGSHIHRPEGEMSSLTLDVSAGCKKRELGEYVEDAKPENNGEAVVARLVFQNRQGLGHFINQLAILHSSMERSDKAVVAVAAIHKEGE